MENDKIRVEIEHAKRISDNAEDIWGWGSPAGKCRVTRRVDAFLQFMGNEGEHQTILEIGSGAGIFSRHLLKRNIKLTALDISFAFIQRSKEATGDKVRYVQGNAEMLPFKDGLLDAIFGISVLHHLNLERTLKEMARLLRKGGRVFFTEPNMLNPQVYLVKNVGFIKRYYNEVPEEFYDLTKDPYETRNLASRQTEEMGEMKRKYFEFISAFGLKGISMDQSANAVPADLRENLKALGYLN